MTYHELTYNATYAFGLILTAFIKNVEISVYHINIYRVIFTEILYQIYISLYFFKVTFTLDTVECRKLA